MNQIIDVAKSADINRPRNGDNGTIKGFEVGAQSFFDFLPAPLDGFGVQANYTYVESKAPGPLAGQSVPLEGLSKHSYNLVGFYEKNGFRARVAYTWRDDYVESTSGPGSGALRARFALLADDDGAKRETARPQGYRLEIAPWPVRGSHTREAERSGHRLSTFRRRRSQQRTDQRRNGYQVDRNRR